MKNNQTRRMSQYDKRKRKDAFLNESQRSNKQYNFKQKLDGKEAIDQMLQNWDTKHKKRNRGGRSSREVVTYIRETLVPNQSNMLILFTSSSEPIQPDIPGLSKKYAISYQY